MPLHLVTGPATSGKTGRVHGPLVAAAREGRGAVLLLPTAADVRRDADEFAGLGVAGIKVRTMSSYVEDLWSVHGDGRAIVSSVARRLLVAEAVRSADLDRLRGSGATPGFTALVAEIAARCWGDRGLSGATPYTREIASVLRAYQRLLEGQGLLESAEAAYLLASAGLGGADVIGVNRFTDLGEHQELFVLGLAAGSDVHAAFTWEVGSPATEALDGLIARLEAAATTREALEGRTDGDELSELARRLFSPEGAPQDPQGAVVLAEAMGPEEECARVAEIARRWIEVDGIAPDRIAVGFKSPERRATYLAAAFAAVGVDVVVDQALPFNRTPFGAAMLALLDMAAGVGDRARLLAFVQSPYSGVDPDRAAALDVVWRRARETSPQKLLRQLAEEGGTAQRAVVAAQAIAMGNLGEQTIGQWQNLSDTLFENAAGTHLFGGAASRADASAHRTVMDAVKEIGRTRETATLVDVVEAIQDAAVASGAIERAGAVLVTEVHRLRGRRFEGVILGGLTSSEFSSERPEPLVASILPLLGLSPGTPERLSERLLFHTVATRASKRLALIRQAADSKGEALRPSVFWEEVVDLYVPAGEQGGEGGPPQALLFESAAEGQAAAIPAFTEGRSALRAKLASAGAPWVRAMGLIADEALLERLAATEIFRVTEIETYAACPYRWFWSSKLRTRSLDREVDAAERGQYAHAILARFYREEFPRLGVERMQTGVMAEAVAGVARAAEKERAKLQIPTVGLVEEMSLEACETWAQAVVVDDISWLPGYHPAGIEVPFGAEGHHFEFAGIRMQGRFDRADLSPEGVVVTDYKSSTSVAGAAKFGESRVVQAVVYAHAAAELFERPIAGALYRSLRSLKARGFVVAGRCDVPAEGSDKDVLDESGLEALTAETAMLVAEAAAGIRSGRIEPDPKTKTTCNYCGAAAFCPKARRGTW